MNSTLRLAGKIGHPEGKRNKIVVPKQAKKEFGTTRGKKRNQK
jgi:hypothetical protein